MRQKITQKNVKALLPASTPYEVHDTEISGFLLRVQPSGAMSYYISYRNAQHTRTRYKIGTHGNLTTAQARDLAIRLAGKIANGEDIQADKKSSRTSTLIDKSKTLQGFVEHIYKDWVIEHQGSGHQTLSAINKHFSQWNTLPLSNINILIVENWITERLKSGISKSTVNRNIATLKSLLSKAVEWDVIETHPLTKLKRLKIDKNICVRFLSIDEEKQLRQSLVERDIKILNDRKNGNEWRKKRGRPLLPDTADHLYADHLTPMALLSINTGIRRGEMFNLKWSDINQNTLTVIGKTAKSGNTRHIPLNEDAVKALKEWQKQTLGTGLIFPNKAGKKLCTIKTAWNNLLTAAMIDNFRWHDLRHHFASKLVMASVPLNTVRELLGHADIATTLRYAHLAPDHKEQAVNKLNIAA